MPEPTPQEPPPLEPTPPDQRPARTPPPWWPAEVPWPPPHRRTRYHLVRRMILMLISFFICSAIFLSVALWVFAQSTGVILAPERDLFASRGLLAFMLIFGFTLAFAGGPTLRRTARTLNDLVVAADQVAQGDYHVRVAVHGPRPLRNLVHAFNTMAARLQADDTQRRHLLADVTHELRTPLSVIQGNLEGLLDGVYPRDDATLTRILDETRILDRLLDDLRTLALAESGALHLQLELTDLSVLAGETLDAFRAQATAASITLHAELSSADTTLAVDPMRIRQVLLNLLANALRYTPPGGTITLTCTPSATAITLSVRDTGRGIAPDALAHLFDRFYKSADSRGSGLGLTIAHNLATAHGGTLTAASTLGVGTTLTLTLPRA